MSTRRLATLFIFGLTACSNADRATTAHAEAAHAEVAHAEGLPDRDPALAHRLVEQEGGIILDVRTPEEFDQGHVEGANNISHDQLEARLAEVEELTGGDKATPVVVYCGSGRRAGVAKEILMRHGYTRVTNVGTQAEWERR